MAWDALVRRPIKRQPPTMGRAGRSNEEIPRTRPETEGPHDRRQRGHRAEPEPGAPPRSPPGNRVVQALLRQGHQRPPHREPPLGERHPLAGGPQQSRRVPQFGDLRKHRGRRKRTPRLAALEQPAEQGL